MTSSPRDDEAERGPRAALCLVEENTGTAWERRQSIVWRVRFARGRARAKSNAERRVQDRATSSP